MKGKLLGRRFLTRGSTRWGRMGFTINATKGRPCLALCRSKSWIVMMGVSTRSRHEV
jgi:hypothetical protein